MLRNRYLPKNYKRSPDRNRSCAPASWSDASMDIAEWFDNPSLTHENINETRLRDASLISWHNNANVLNQACSQGDPESAVCVQLSFDSRNSAIHNAYRILRRPSSLFEPRHPSLKVVRNFFTIDSDQDWKNRLDITKLSCKFLNCVSCNWSFRRFTYGNLVTTSPSSKQ